jgi:signal peptidase II
MLQRVKELGLLALVAALVVVPDQITKRLVIEHVPLGTAWAPFPSLSSWFTITHVSNTGAAFGMFPQLSGVFQMIAILVIIGIVLYSHRLTAGQRLVTISLGFQLGGALGNLIDRLRIGHVVDFLDFKVWPVFNVADMSIVLGVGLLLWTLFRAPEQLAMPVSSADDEPSPC